MDDLSGFSADEIKEISQKQGFDIVGIADPGKLELSDDHNWVNSILVLGLWTPDDSVDAYIGIQYDGKKVWNKWIYDITEKNAWRICNVISERGYKAAPSKGFDLKKAAVITGLGSIGKNNLLLTKKFGPRLRMIGIMTDAVLDFDRPVVQDLCTKCDMCIKACPGGALTTNGKYDRKKCLAEFDPSPELLKKQKQKENRLSRFTVKQCTECMFSCPVGEKIEASTFD